MSQKYVAVNSCGHMGDRIKPGEEVPIHWPNDAIDYLLSKGHIKEVEDLEEEYTDTFNNDELIEDEQLDG